MSCPKFEGANGDGMENGSEMDKRISGCESGVKKLNNMVTELCEGQTVSYAELTGTAS